jgi:hypothetical protein
MLRIGRFFRAFAVFGGVAAMAGCAHEDPAIFVRAADPTAFKDARPGQTLVIEFNEGETIPLAFSIRGQFLETLPDAPAVTLVARRHFFLRVHGREMKTSLDGVHFDAKHTAPGEFSIGFGFSPTGTNAHIAIVTPKYDLPAP